MQEPAAAMRATNRIFEHEVVAQRNWQALGQVYTEDATILPPGAQAITGLAHIRQFWSDAITQLDAKSVTLKSSSVTPGGDGFVEIGAVAADTATGPLAGKYVVFWKQEGGAWKWHVDIWNLNS